MVTQVSLFQGFRIYISHGLPYIVQSDMNASPNACTTANLGLTECVHDSHFFAPDCNACMTADRP
jgi:hypothetical protein